MINMKINFNGSKVRVGSFGFAATQMLLIGGYANNVLKARVRAGMGSDDSPLPPLSQKKSVVRINHKFARQRVGYAQWKAAHGLSPRRDMWGTGKDGGHMLDNSTVRYADDSTVKIAFTSRKARAKAISNERRTPFYSFSQADTAKIMRYATVLFKGNVKLLIRKFTMKRAA